MPVASTMRCRHPFMNHGGGAMIGIVASLAVAEWLASARVISVSGRLLHVFEFEVGSQRHCYLLQCSLQMGLCG